MDYFDKSQNLHCLVGLGDSLIGRTLLLCLDLFKLGFFCYHNHPTFSLPSIACHVYSCRVHSCRVHSCCVHSCRVQCCRVHNCASIALFSITVASKSRVGTRWDHDPGFGKSLNKTLLLSVIFCQIQQILLSFSFISWVLFIGSLPNLSLLSLIPELLMIMKRLPYDLRDP